MSRGAGTPDFFYREAQRLGYVARSAFKYVAIDICSLFLGIEEEQLLQIQKQYKLITSGSSVLDLGCAPGAWLQVACQSLGPLKNGGAVVGIDIKCVGGLRERQCKAKAIEQTVKVPSMHCDVRVQTVCADVMNLQRDQVIALSPQKKGFSVILSDMCPLVSGITSRDAALSSELGMRALDLAVGRAVLAAHSENDMPVAADSDCGVLRPGGHLIVKLLESEYIKEFREICNPLFRKASWLRPKATRSCSREIYLICQGLQ